MDRRHPGHDGAMSDDDAPLSRTGIWMTRLVLLLVVVAAVGAFFVLGR
jgi:hypothetical protein